MGIVYTKDLLPGMVTDQDVRNFNDEIILPAKTFLTEKLIAKLEYYSIPEIIVEGSISSIQDKPESSGYSERILKSEEFKQFKQYFETDIEILQTVMRDIRERKNPIDYSSLIEQTKKLMPKNATTLATLDMIHNMRTYYDSTYAHCINVALISRIMAKWLHFNEKDTDILTLCGLLHDIGKTSIPDAIINKPGKLTSEEYEMVKEHVTKGYELLKDQNIDERVKFAALMHHERCDGSGYPNQTPGNEINDFSKIIAIADVYDAMTAARVYRGAQSPFKVISVFEEEGLQKYDPHFILTFLERIGSSYINNDVQLSDGRIGEVVMINPSSLAHPMVKIGDDYIDLSKTSELDIVQIV